MDGQADKVLLLVTLWCALVCRVLCFHSVGLTRYAIIWLAGDFWQRQSEEWRWILLELVVLEYIYPSMVCQWPQRPVFFFFRVQRPVFCSRPSKIVADLQCSKIWNGIAAVVCVSSDNMACTLHNVNVVSNCWISIELLTAKFVNALFLKEKMVSVYWIFFSQLDKLDPLRWPIALHSTSSTIRGQKWSNPDIQIGMLFSLSGYHIGVNSHWHKKSSY